MPSTSQSSPAHSRESFAIRERTSSGERASSACTRTGASIFGQTAARQSLQSRNSAQQLFLMQHLKAVRALAPLSTSCASPSSSQKMGHTHQQLAASTFHLILYNSRKNSAEQTQYKREAANADRGGLQGFGQEAQAAGASKPTVWRYRESLMGRTWTVAGWRALRPRHLKFIAFLLCADDSAINNLSPRVSQRAKG